jgi:uncharacterized protein YukE
MSGFHVAPGALDTYAKTLGGDSGALDSKFANDAKPYVEKWVKLESGDGGMIFNFLVGKVGEVCDRLNSDFASIASCLTGSAGGLTRSAQAYLAQDRASADHLDSIYKTGAVTPLDDSVDAKDPEVDPSSKLTEPSSEGAVPDMVQQILDGAGFFSESEIVLKILTVCGLDVEGWVKERFFGNFEAVAKSRNAVKNLANFDTATATNIAEGAQTMLSSWQGNAADAAHSYFDQLSNGIEGHANALSQVAQRYDAVLVAIQQAGSAIMGGITAALDAGVEAGAALAAAGCLEEVPGLDVLMDIIGAWRVTKVILKIHEIANIWNAVWSGSEGMMGLITILVGGLSSFDASAKLPKIGYANAAQGAKPNGSPAPQQTGGKR